MRVRKALLRSLLLRRDVKGNSPLHLACMLGSLDMSELAGLSQREGLMQKNEEGQTPFHLAAR